MLLVTQYKLSLILGNGKVHLPAGVSRYPFCIKLPQNIPCSFENCNGYIRYTIKANIIKSWRLNSECEAPFTVIAAYDLNIRREQCVSEIDIPNCYYDFIIFTFENQNI